MAATQLDQATEELALAARAQWTSSGVRLGIDAVAVGNIEESLTKFGERFLQRIFTPHEVLIANGSAERLATRFAAKEAAIKAFDLSEAGVDWRDIELRSDESGRPRLRLSGRALASALAFGVREPAVSLAHENGMALAVVVGLPQANARLQRSAAKTATA